MTQDVSSGLTDRGGLTNWEALIAELRTGRVKVPASGTGAKAAGKQRGIRLVAVVNPNIDVGKFARAFSTLAARDSRKAAPKKAA